MQIKGLDRAPSPARKTLNDDLATMLSDIRQAHDSYVPGPGGSPPPKPPDKPGHHWLGGHLSLEGLEHLLEAKAEAADAVDTALHGAQMGMSTGMMMAASTLGAASGALGLVLLKNGAEDVKEGIGHKDWAHTAEGIGSLIVGTRGLAAGAATVGHLLPQKLVLAKTAALAGKLLGPLGLIHGAIDAGLGVNDLVTGINQEDGWKITKGALGIGMGTSLMAAAAGGGLPALASAGVFLTGKVWHDLKSAEEEKKRKKP